MFFLPSPLAGEGPGVRGQHNVRHSISIACGAWLFVLLASAATHEPEVVNSIGMHFVPLKAGEFLRGSADEDAEADDDERPQRHVRITRPFALGRYEVSQREYQTVMGENPSWFSATGGGRSSPFSSVDAAAYDDRPVEMVSWEEAVDFCRRLSALPAERAAGRKYRLPTEAEWEYAARAGGSARYGNTDALSPSDAVLLFDAGRPRETSPTRSHAPNAWGLHNMQGNVWEWCSDWYDADYYRVAPTDDPQGPKEGTGRVVRGGDYRSPPQMARAANRDFTRATRRDWGNGIRVVLELP